MKECPILFSAPMVQAILSGRKSQTRRVVKPQPHDPAAGLYGEPSMIHGSGSYMQDHLLAEGFDGGTCPYGQPGDHLWVKEAWQYADWTDDGYPWVRYAADRQKLLHESIPQNWAERLNDTWEHLSRDENYGIDNCAADRRMRSSRFMPRWASRITLEITGVRVERLQDISEADAIVEGIERVGGAMSCSPWKNYRIGKSGEMSMHCSAPTRSYMTLWESINGPGSWDKNPWVWVIEFHRVPQDA